MKLILLLLLFSFYSNPAQRYVEPDKIKQFNVVVNQDDQIIKTQILKNPKKIRIDKDASYTWYNMNKLIETRNGYDGKLLHGYYKVFFLNDQLKESGFYKYGLKTDTWRYWYSNGSLREIITWKKGRKTGFYAIYNNQGKVMAEGNFKNDLLDDVFYTYDNFGNIAEKKKYKMGKEVVINSTAELKPDHDTVKKESFIQRIFKKKRSAPKVRSTPTSTKV